MIIQIEKILTNIGFDAKFRHFPGSLHYGTADSNFGGRLAGGLDYMNRWLILTVIFLAAGSFAVAQNPAESTPPGVREAMLKFIELNNKQLLKSDEARQLLTDEAKEWSFVWFGQTLSPPDKIVSLEKNYAVARVQAVEKNARVVDLYFYLKFDDGWKVQLMRALALTHFLEAIETGLKSKAALTADEKESLANAELTLSSDKLLTEWFQKNRTALDKLVAVVLLETKKKPVKARVTPRPKMKKGQVEILASVMPDDLPSEPQTIDYIGPRTQKFPRSAAALKVLYLSGVETKSNGNIEIVIGGITDNTVGFIYSPKGTPPPIDERRYIWVEKVAAGWYLFRTT